MITRLSSIKATGKKLINLIFTVIYSELVQPTYAHTHTHTTKEIVCTNKVL